MIGARIAQVASPMLRNAAKNVGEWAFQSAVSSAIGVDDNTSKAIGASQASRNPGAALFGAGLDLAASFAKPYIEQKLGGLSRKQLRQTHSLPRHCLPLI